MVETCSTKAAYAYHDLLLAALSAANYSVYLSGFSAIDAYLGCAACTDVRLLTNAGVADLARLFENLRYPGVDIADAALDQDTEAFYFFCADTKVSRSFFDVDHHPSFKFLEFYQDWKTRRFYDPCGLYPLLRQIKGNPFQDNTCSLLDILRNGLNPAAERRHALMDAALIVARYFPGTETDSQPEYIMELFQDLSEGPPPKAEEQRLLLTGLLTAPHPGLGLELLKSGGFIKEFWPEIAVLDDVDHAKEFHPEGNAWKHTLETFRYRKTMQDMRLSLGLLLHDVGKPIAKSVGSRRFDGHAELGERQARRFLERLAFAPSLINDVCYLVKNHMIPAALPRLPLLRTEGIMASSLFPTLLELYRCDESSSFKGLGSYYESSAAYQSFLRYRRNPYRSLDGKKRHFYG